jgi:uncharacterized protein
LIASALSFVAGLSVLLLVFLDSLGSPNSYGGFISNPLVLDQALQGTFMDSVVGRANALPEALLVQFAINWFLALSMFLLGLAAGRSGLLAQPSQHLRLWRSLVAIGLVFGLPAGILSAWLTLIPEDSNGVYSTLGIVLGFALAPALSAGYVGAIALISHYKFMKYTEPAGRMSLTGYLGESIILSAIFCGWGLGLFGVLSLSQAFVVALTVWVSLELFAKFWLRWFSYGPFEWALRCWSNWEIVPIRKKQHKFS